MIVCMYSAFLPIQFLRTTDLVFWNSPE